jgi:hypothetical protein
MTPSTFHLYSLPLQIHEIFFTFAVYQVVFDYYLAAPLSNWLLLQKFYKVVMQKEAAMEYVRWNRDMVISETYVETNMNPHHDALQLKGSMVKIRYGSRSKSRRQGPMFPVADLENSSPWRPYGKGERVGTHFNGLDVRRWLVYFPSFPKDM